MENLFEHILDDDETIVKVFKPKKSKLFWSATLKMLLFWLPFLIVAIFAILFPDEDVTISAVYVLIPIGIYIVLPLISLIFVQIYYNNLYYAYSNKRVIIRSGIFGVDYRSLDMSMIGAVDVSVSLLDKILNKNTGSLSFGSSASPVVNNNANVYRFTHILAPYETCKEIKSYIDSYKKQLNKN